MKYIREEIGFFSGKPQNYPEPLNTTEVQKRFLDLLGSFEKASVPLNIRVTDENLLEGNVICQRIEYDVALGESVPAFHLFRKGIAPHVSGVLSIHAHGEEDGFREGKAWHCHPDPQDPSQYSYRAALSGFRVLAPDALCFGERQIDWGYSQFFLSEVVTHAELCGKGLSLAWKSVWDNSRALEVLENLGADSLGCIGHSGGSTQGYILAAVNPKIRAAACFQSFATLRHQFYQYRLVHCLYHYIPGMIKAGIDWDQVVALAAPRPFFFGWGQKDKGTPEIMYHAFVDAIHKRCKEEGLPVSVFTHVEEQEGHNITEAMLSNALEFLAKYL